MRCSGGNAAADRRSNSTEALTGKAMRRCLRSSRHLQGAPLQAGFEFFASTFHRPTARVVTQPQTGTRVRARGDQAFDLTRRSSKPPFGKNQRNLPQGRALDGCPDGPRSTPPSVRLGSSDPRLRPLLRLSCDVAQVAASRRFPGPRPRQGIKITQRGKALQGRFRRTPRGGQDGDALTPAGRRNLRKQRTD